MQITYIANKFVDVVIVTKRGPGAIVSATREGLNQLHSRATVLEGDWIPYIYTQKDNENVMYLKQLCFTAYSRY